MVSGSLVGLKFTNACVNLCSRVVVPLWQLKDGATCQEVDLNSSTGLKGLEVVAPNAVQDRVLLYFHGGAHCLFSPHTHRELLGRISAAARARVVAVNYSKAPDRPFPAGLNDALASWHWVAQKYPNALVAVGGDSSGGNLAFALLLRLVELDLPRPVAGFGLSPWLLLHSAVVEERTPEALKPKFARFHRNASWAADLYRGGHPSDDPFVSPALASVELVAKLPPVLIHASADEPLAVDAKEMASLCEQAGVAVELKLFDGVPHVFQGFPLLFPKSTRDSLHLLTLFLERHWNDQQLLQV
mmetsp:Transcript_89627/g.236425  ORF Transcript_89627/g.236425 Transcript_89627/m.236425 type:complete len:301 (+) Transcript_89627:72-974(+)